MDSQLRLNRAFESFYKKSKQSAYNRSGGRLVVYKMRAVTAPDGLYFTHCYNNSEMIYSISFASWQTIKEKKGLETVAGSTKFYELLLSKKKPAAEKEPEKEKEKDDK